VWLVTSVMMAAVCLLSMSLNVWHADETA
jgi:hypothetical protein